MSCIVASVESLSTLSTVLTRPDIFGDGWVGGYIFMILQELAIFISLLQV